MNYYKFDKDKLDRLYNLYNFLIGNKRKKHTILIEANEKYKSDEEIKQIIFDTFIPREEIEVIIKRK